MTGRSRSPRGDGTPEQIARGRSAFIDALRLEAPDVVRELLILTLITEGREQALTNWARLYNLEAPWLLSRLSAIVHWVHDEGAEAKASATWRAAQWTDQDVIDAEQRRAPVFRVLLRNVPPVAAYPDVETRDEFLARADAHYRARARGISPLRQARRAVPSDSRRACWLVRFQVLRQAPATIGRAAHVGEGSVYNAVNDFAALIELPLREPQRAQRTRREPKKHMIYP